jgi:16S rRNA (guanine(527)-N(7))-methyltransferase RsmG
MTAANLQLSEFKEALGAQASIYQQTLSGEIIEQLSEYYALLVTWNPRLHLVAPCSPREFATRHVLESLMLLPHLQSTAQVADVGSGGGLPIIPCLIARRDITATLIESSRKKAIFLREALNRVGAAKSANVIADRFENIPAPDAGYISCRALERFEEKLPDLIRWSPEASTLLLFGGEGLRAQIVDKGLSFTDERIPNSQRRFLFVISRAQDGL